VGADNHPDVEEVVELAGEAGDLAEVLGPVAFEQVLLSCHSEPEGEESSETTILHFVQNDKTLSLADVGHANH
jgi:hypothetical protein